MFGRRKKEIINTLIERIELFEDKTADGRIIKAIYFKFPLCENGENANAVFLSEGNNAETVVLLERKI